MSNSKNFYDAALLSEIAYIDFGNIDLSADNSDERVKDALEDPDLGSNLTPHQVDYFMKNWEVLSHQENTERGFSATLFKNKKGEYYYASRGTEPWSRDLWIDDIGNIVIDGLSFEQIVDMYNDWQRIIAPKGRAYDVFTLDLLAEETRLLQEELEHPFGSSTTYMESLRDRDDIIIDMPTGNVYTIRPVRSDQLFSDDRKEGLGAFTGTGVTAVGHSLGGHLSVAFSRLFSICDDVMTINGAGYMTGDLEGLSGNAETNISNLFDMLGGSSSFSSSEILNMYGDSAPEVVTMDFEFGLKQQGRHHGVYIESVGLGEAFGHGKNPMTDALAVYDLFIRLDARYETDDAEEQETLFSELLPVFDAVEFGRNNKVTLESVVNIFGELFVNDFTPLDLGHGNVDRSDLYRAISQVQLAIDGKSLTINTLVGLTDSDIADLAVQENETGLATRYALVNLIPFTITGDSTLYDNLNTNGELDIYNGDHEGYLSSKYIEDRALFLYTMMQGENTTIRFKDLLMGAFIPQPMRTEYFSEYTFGRETNEFLNGAVTEDDSLYGRGGDDWIRGIGGNDYIEGGKGRDIMDGGIGDDTFGIFGEDTDYDIFNGETGYDTIEGSDGDDTIRVQSLSLVGNSIEEIKGGTGTDTIAGTEEDNRIDLTGINVTGIEQIEGEAGGDTLIGTNSDDIIYGGSKDAIEDDAIDHLEGGAGNDTYYIGAGDTIKDSDDQGTIYFGDELINGLTLTQIG